MNFFHYNLITRAFYRIPTIYKKKKTTAIYCKTIVNIDQRKMPKVFDKQTFAVSCKNCRTVYTLLLQEKQNGKPLCLYIKKHEFCSCRLIVVLSNAARNDFLSFSQIKVKKPFPFHCQRSWLWSIVFINKNVITTVRLEFV